MCGSPFENRTRVGFVRLFDTSLTFGEVRSLGASPGAGVEQIQADPGAANVSHSRTAANGGFQARRSKAGGPAVDPSATSTTPSRMPRSSRSRRNRKQLTGEPAGTTPGSAGGPSNRSGVDQIEQVRTVEDCVEIAHLALLRSAAPAAVKSNYALSIPSVHSSQGVKLVVSPDTPHVACPYPRGT